MLVVMTTREWLFFLRAWLNRHLIAIYTKQTPTWKHKIQYTHSATYVGLSSWICVNKSLQSGFRSSDMCIKCFCTNKSHRIRCGNVICIYKKWLTERDRVGECVSASVWRERRMLLIFTICNFTICRWWKWWNFLYFPADMFFLSLKLALSLALIFHRYNFHRTSQEKSSSALVFLIIIVVFLANSLFFASIIPCLGLQMHLFLY